MALTTQRQHAGAPTTEGSWRPLLVWLGCLTVALVGLLAVGEGGLRGPELLAPTTWGPWLAATDPVVAVVAVLRIVALALAWYLVGITGVSLAAHLLRSARLVRLADLLSVGPVKVVVQQAVGASLAVGVLAGVGGPAVTGVGAAGPALDGAAQAAAATQGEEEGASMRPLGAGAAAGAVGAAPSGAADDAGDTAAMRRLDGAPAGAAAMRAVTPPVPTPPAATPVDAAAVEAAPVDPVAPDDDRGRAGEHVDRRRTVVVRAGDHLWALAETDVAAALGREPTEDEVAGHWERVVDANAAHLAVPGNPDLLLPGQDVVLPRVEVAP